MFKLFILPVLAAALAFGQPPGGGSGAGAKRGPAFTNIKAYLGLSDTQVESILASNRASRDANRDLAQQMRAKREALQTTLDNGSTDAAAIGRAVLDIQALRKQLEANRAKTREQALSFLSAEQKTKLDALKDAAAQRRALREAAMLQLLAPPERTMGPGPRRGGPGMRHFGGPPARI